MDSLRFPVQIICPDCHELLRPTTQCSCSAHTQLEVWNGIPRTLFGQGYWGECSSKEMREILALTEIMSWKEALETVAAGKPVHTHVTSNVGPEFVYGLPWRQISRVLDIGAGMGFLTVRLAKMAEHVVALEAVPERALFLTRRAAQERLSNIHAIIADATALPFPPESFDLVTLNGVLEYIGLWGHGDPRHLQMTFLKNVFTLLRPTGYLYIGVETRYGTNQWLGRRDHSGLRYTSLMPRWLANWYCRWRHKPCYGGERPVQGYRTYTYTPEQYRSLLSKAGFESVEIHGCFPGYNSQHAIYPLGSYPIWRHMRGLVDRPVFPLGVLRRLLTDAPLTYDKFEDDVLLLARKQRASGPLTIGSYVTSRTGSAQLNSSDKVSLIRFVDGCPVSVGKAGKNVAAQRRLAQEYEFLTTVAGQREPANLEVRIPKPIAVRSENGLTLYEYEYVQGDLLATYLNRLKCRVTRFLATLHRLIHGYLRLCCHFEGAIAGGKRKDADVFLEELRHPCRGDQSVERKLDNASAQFRKQQWRLSWVHGDLSLYNTIVTGQGLVLIDWEHVSSCGLTGIDLIRLLYSTWQVTSLLRQDLRKKVMTAAGRAIRQALERLGFDSQDCCHLGALFVAHQYKCLVERAVEPLKPIGDYHCQVERVLGCWLTPA